MLVKFETVTLTAVAAATEATAKRSARHGEFRCFCGEWFPDRVSLDSHLVQHPTKVDLCDSCKRPLPKGSWEVDEAGTFALVEESVERTRQASKESTST
jgi:hypothetical protein